MKTNRPFAGASAYDVQSLAYAGMDTAAQLLAAVLLVQTLREALARITVKCRAPLEESQQTYVVLVSV